MSKSIEELRADLAAAEAEAQKPVEILAPIPKHLQAEGQAYPLPDELVIETPSAAAASIDTHPEVITPSGQPPCDNDHVAEGCEKFPDGFVEAKPEEGWDVPDAPIGVSGLDAPTPGVVASFTDVSLSESDTARLKERGEFEEPSSTEEYFALPEPDNLDDIPPGWPPDTSGEFSGIKVPEPIGPLGLPPVDPSRDFLETAREHDLHFHESFQEWLKDGKSFPHGTNRPEEFSAKPPVFSDELRAFLNRWFHEDTAKFLYNQISTSHHVARLNTPQ